MGSLFSKLSRKLMPKKKQVYDSGVALFDSKEELKQQTGFLDVRESTAVFVRTKPPMKDLRREWLEIGYCNIRLGGRVYEVWGWERDAKNKIRRDAVVLREEGKNPIATPYPIKVYESLTRYIECVYFEEIKT